MMKRARILLRNAFDDANSRLFSIVNDILALATLLSVIAIILETVEALAPYDLVFKAIEYGTVVLFTLEYLGRLAVAKSKPGYIFSFFGVIDLLAIIPTYLALGNLTFLKTARSLRILRFLRMLRLAKLARIGEKPGGAQSLYRLNIQIYAVALTTALLVLGSLLFLFEGDKPYARDLPTSMFWAFKAVLGGLPYPQPETAAGTAVLVLARFASMILLGLMLGLVGTLTRKALIGSEKDS